MVQVEEVVETVVVDMVKEVVEIVVVVIPRPTTTTLQVFLGVIQGGIVPIQVHPVGATVPATTGVLIVLDLSHDIKQPPLFPPA